MKKYFFSKITSCLFLIIFVLAPVTVRGLSYQELQNYFESLQQGKVLGDTTGVLFTLNQVGLQSLTYNGTSYLSRPISTSDYGAGVSWFIAPDGTSKCYGWCATTLDNMAFHIGTATKTSGTNYFEHKYRDGLPGSVTVRNTFTVTDSKTLKVDLAITNNDATDTLNGISPYIFTPIRLPGPINSFNVNDVISMGAYGMNDRPEIFFRGDWGSMIVWPNDYSDHVSMSSNYGSSSQTDFQLSFSNYEQHNRTSSSINRPILPGQTYTYTFYIRFGGGSSDSAATLSPEAYQNFRSVFPYLVNWPDRRPVARLFLAEGGHTTATNPRGYFYNNPPSISNQADFNTKALAYADNSLSIMNAMNPKPQGIMVWDLEGQEFYHYFTYVGTPNKLPEMAPEMDAVADQFFAKFRDAGYKIGMTLRPMTFKTGTTLPSTCTFSNETVHFSDVFIKTDAQYPYRGYACTASNTWTQPGAKLPYYQTVLNDDEEIYNNLKAKVSYARNRWGATMFYVDSTVYERGEPILFTIFRRLQQDFPDVVFFPENVNQRFWGGSSPYGQANMGMYGPYSGAKLIYPQSFSLIQATDGINYSDPVTYNKLVQAVKDGNILFVDGWWGSNNASLLQVYRDAGVTNTSTSPMIDTTPPSVPSGLTATAVSSGRVNLSWSASTDNVGVIGYKVYRAGSLLATATTTSFSDLTVSPSTSYSYTVSALDSAGNQSAQSIPATVTTPAIIDIVAPVISGLSSAGVDQSTAIISWQTNEPATGELYYSPVSNPYYQLLTKTSLATSFVSNLSGLTSNTQYQYYVVARDATGNSSTSTLQNFTTLTNTIDTTPPVISSVVAKPNKKVLVISWSTNEPATTQVEYGLSNSLGTLTPLVSVLSNSHSVSIKNLIPNTTYYFRVLSKDFNGNLATSNVYSIITKQGQTILPDGVVTGDTVKFTGDQTIYIAEEDGLYGFDSYQSFQEYLVKKPQQSSVKEFPTLEAKVKEELVAQEIVARELLEQAPQQKTTVNKTASKFATGSLVNDQGTIYLIIGTTKIPFTNFPAFQGLGYKINKVLNADTSAYSLAQTYQINAPNEEHPWSSWLILGRTIYYATQGGMIPIPSMEIFTANGGNLESLLIMNPADQIALAKRVLTPMIFNDERIIK